MSRKILEIESLSDDPAAQASDYRYANVIPTLRLSRPVVVVRAGGAPTTCKVSGEKDPDCIVLDAGPEVAIEVDALADRDVGCVVAIAHGLTDRLGFEGTSLFMTGMYPRVVVADKIVHLVACYAAESVGQDMLNNGCLYFFGYQDKLDLGDTDDELAVVLDCDAEIDRRLARGEPARAVEAAVRLKYEEAIKTHEKSNPDFAGKLRRNLDSLVCRGPKPDACLDP